MEILTVSTAFTHFCSGFRGVFALIFLVLQLFLPRGQAATLDPLAEYRIKAAYLYNFTKFVEWPPAAFTDVHAPYVIGIMEGDTTVSRAMKEVLNGKTTRDGRTIQVRSATETAALNDCHLIFVAREVTLSPEIAARLKTLPILLVGESAGFAQSGGTINFVISGDVIRLEINAQRAERLGLRLSGTLASVGILVRDREGAP